MWNAYRQFYLLPNIEVVFDQSWGWKYDLNGLYFLNRNAGKRENKNFTRVYEELAWRVETLPCEWQALITCCIYPYCLEV